jgi:hypothetical protein
MRTIVLPQTALRLYAVMKIKPIRAKKMFLTPDAYFLYFESKYWTMIVDLVKNMTNCSFLLKNPAKFYMTEFNSSP